ncbi:hypothetical protein AB0I39_13765 [Kitasatospora purpeofusca]|uniref:hypothetical protein n=1 Tax=Kitasatospora purpeofusca TaxID=67352 RepID=UPI00340D298E
MRLRHTLVAAAGALVLTLAVPTSAHAANGEFEYANELGLPALLIDPQSGECIDLPLVSDKVPGSAPWNRTDATATVFLDFGCEGDTYYVMDPGKKLGPQLKLRSVIFS